MSAKNKKQNQLKSASRKLSTGLLITSVLSTSLAPMALADTTVRNSLPTGVGLPELLQSTIESGDITSSSQVIESSTVESSSPIISSSESSLDVGTSSTTTSSSSTANSSSTASSSNSSTNSTSSSKTNSSSSTKPSTSTSKSKGQNASSSSSKKTDVSTSQSSSSNDKKTSDSITNTGTISYSHNQTTQQFIDEIGKDARIIGDKNDLYASVMIAQAILESASGNSMLARSPNFNLFGIKGSYQGEKVSLPTLEDNGSGAMYSINANFRKYPSYKESLEDYARLIKGGTNSSDGYYAGAWKSNTKNYKDATAHLTGRYATDTRYNEKLNGLIETYDLQQYDNAPKVNRKVKVTRHKVAEGETVWDVSKKYGTPVTRLKELNKWTEKTQTLKKDDVIVVKRKTYVTEEPKKTEVTEENAKETANKNVNATEISKKELALAKEAKEIVVLKASKLGHSIKNAVPSALFSSKAPQVIGRQVKSDKTYYVAKNDSITEISKKTGVSVDDLVSWNNLENSILTEGQVLLIEQ